MEALSAGDDLEATVDAAIAACDGKTRATIRALLVTKGFLHARVAAQRLGVARLRAREALVGGLAVSTIGA